jgi:hypothetical protein
MVVEVAMEDDMAGADVPLKDPTPEGPQGDKTSSVVRNGEDTGASRSDGSRGQDWSRGKSGDTT